jgi:hypothetical protein
MPIETKALDQVDEQDLRVLIADASPERLIRDYKATLPGTSNGDRKEFLYDVSSFANAAGGHLIYGMVEQGGVPIDIPGVPLPDPEADVLRLAQMARTGIDPRILGLEWTHVPLSSSNFAVVARIPRSWTRPHLVTFQTTNKFYSRTAAGKYLLDVREIGELYLASEALQERVREFRDKRLAAIISEGVPFPVAGPKAVLHVLPLDSFSREARERADRLFSELWLGEQWQHIRPRIPGNDFGRTITVDGLVSYCFDLDRAPHAYTQIFLTGAVEAVEAHSFREEVTPYHRGYIRGFSFEERVLEQLTHHSEALGALDVSPPVIVLLSLLHVEGYELVADAIPYGHFNPHPFDRDMLLLPTVRIDEWPADLAQPMRIAFDRLWNAAGWPRSPYYDAEGNWGHRTGSTRGETPKAAIWGESNRATLDTQRLGLADRRMSDRLFDTLVRTDRSGSRHAESRFAFLNRVQSQFFGKVRDLLEEWFHEWPQERRAQLRGRFRSDDERQMLGAFWELYLHETLRRLRFQITYEPDVGEGRAKPDFLAERKDGAFYLEATVAGPSDAEVAGERRRDRVYDALNRLRSPDFMLWLDVDEEGPADPRASRLRPRLKRWLEGLDPDAVARGFEERRGDADSLAGVDSLPAYRWQEEGWDAVFRAIPKKPEARGDPSVRPLGAFGPGKAVRIDTSGPFLRALESKASSYGVPDRPLVLALLGYGSFVREWSVERALFGSEGYVFSSDPAQEGPIRNPDGFWVAPKGIRYRRVAAVLGGANLLPWKVAGTALHLWHNPWATKPLTVDFPWSTTRVDLSGNRGTFQREEAKLTPHELFGLPPEWPGPEDLEG